MINLVFIGYTWGELLVNAVKELKEIEKITILYPHEIDDEIYSKQKLYEIFSQADGIIIDLRGGGKAEELVYESLSELYETKKVIIVVIGSPRLLSLARLGKFSMKKIFEKRQAQLSALDEPLSMIERIKKIQKIIEFAGKILPIASLKDAREYILALKYLANPLKENYVNFFKLIGKHLGLSYRDIQPCKELPEFGIYYPNLGIFESLNEFLKQIAINEDPNSKEKPKLGILYYGGIHFQQSLPFIEAIVKTFKDFLCIPVFCDGIYNLEAIKRFFFVDGKPIVSAVLSLLWFRLNGGPFGGQFKPTLELLKSLNMPVFNPVIMYRREIEKWQESDYGLNYLEVIGAVIWPEMDGRIEPIPIAGLKSIGREDVQTKEILPIEERIEKIERRIKNWLNLKLKKNEEKRVALVIYNYPPGEENLGKAAYLDVFKSVENLLHTMKREGYKVDLPKDFNLYETLEKLGAFNSPEWISPEECSQRGLRTVETKSWKEWLEELSPKAKGDLVYHWGEPPGKIMVYRDKILIPCLELGNVLIGVQPARAPLTAEDVKNVVHDKTKPPHHQYVTFYKWLEKEWKADVVVHIGTHGLAEFTKGKEVGMSENCFPDILIGDIPHLYFYHTLNTSEGTIAKRRLYGTLISYNSPPYTTSDTYEELRTLEDYLNEYEEASHLDPGRARILEEKIKELGEKLNFAFDTLEELHDQVYRIKRSIIPKGLHILGKNYEENDLIEFVKLFSRYDRGEVKSLNRLIAEEEGLKYEEVYKNPKLLAQIEKMSNEVIDRFLKDPSTLKETFKSKKQKAEAEKTINLAIAIGKRFIDNEEEIKNFLLGLQGGYIEPSVGGDVIRTPEALPTGKNIYQFDPNKIPTDSAYVRGFEIAKNTIETYLKLKGTYPEKVGLVLWGFETTQTQGETIAQILSYMGVKIVRRYGSWYPELEITPLEELKRPRIDCHITICGFFREMFPNVINLIDKAVNLVSNLDEPIELNFVKKHTLENLKNLREMESFRNVDESTLRKIACGRIFGPPPSEYGTRMLKLVEDSVWEKEEELAEAYMESMNYLYIENSYGVKAREVYKESLKRVDLVSQIRSSHDYEFTDLDHYFEFFGGLSLAVEAVKGSKPLMLVSDTTKEIPLTESLEKSIEVGVRTRLLNPKWIKAMLEHKVHGAQKIADLMENLVGWAATTGVVENWIWNEVTKRFVLDEEIKKEMIKNNKWAYLEVLQRLMEANRRGYWKAEEKLLEHIRRAILETEGIIEETLTT